MAFTIGALSTGCRVGGDYPFAGFPIQYLGELGYRAGKFWPNTAGGVIIRAW